MNDLHGWTTQQVDRVEAAARAATPGPWVAKTIIYGKPEDGYGPPTDWEIHAGKTEVVSHLMHEGGGIQHGPDAIHIVSHNPAAVLRRCEADRRILERHRLATEWTWSFDAPCHGCGTEGDCDDPVTDQLNQCPELLDLGHAHGLTPEVLATLDKPPTVHQERTLRGPLPDTRRVPAALRGPNWSSR